MFGFKNIDIVVLETKVMFLEKDKERMSRDIYLLQGDLRLLMKYLNVDVENINQRVITKKGGPEKGD